MAGSGSWRSASAPPGLMEIRVLRTRISMPAGMGQGLRLAPLPQARRGALGALSGAKEKPPGRRLFSFSLYRFRIPNLHGFPARFWEEFWRGSAFVSGVVTFVRGGGGLTRFPQSEGKVRIREQRRLGGSVEGSGMPVLRPDSADASTGILRTSAERSERVWLVVAMI